LIDTISEFIANAVREYLNRNQEQQSIEELARMVAAYLAEKGVSSKIH
jgi:metal-responsive CopG/Arc/MetJ family transcriptional regulator